ncbi:MAG TPA: hypothetical protein VK203_22395 [Nostocaceae cyanobacterium]|nr:hypothetical protein [Nostocaceae cyanobacterium]
MAKRPLSCDRLHWELCFQFSQTAIACSGVALSVPQNNDRLFNFLIKRSAIVGVMLSPPTNSDRLHWELCFQF